MRVESEVGRGSTFAFTIPQADPINVLRRYLKRMQIIRESSSVSFLSARIDPSVDPGDADDVDALLNWVLRRRDLIFREDTHQWLIFLTASADETQRFFMRVVESREETNRNRPYGKLPVIDLKLGKSWCLNGNETEILDYVQEIVALQEFAHA